MKFKTAFELGQSAVFRIKNFMGNRAKPERHHSDIAPACPATLIVDGHADVSRINPRAEQGKSS